MLSITGYAIINIVSTMSVGLAVSSAAWSL